MDLAELLAHANMVTSSAEAPKIDPEVALMRLREVAARHAEADAGPRFKVGDVVTPASDSNIKGASEPHVVVATWKATHNFDDREDVGSCKRGCRDDLRVICFQGEHIVPFWVESSEFTLWLGSSDN